ncbi:MAG: GatB/YqeY domain-containing protein [Marinilabiliales bacterium]
MSLFEQINEDLKAAMIAKDKERLEAIRAVKSAFLLAKTEKGNKDLDDATAINIISKLVKQRKESAEIYKQNNRNDLAEKELFQADVIAKYLPEQLTEDELKEEIIKIIAETGASSIKDMKNVMSVATKKIAGKADNKTLANIVKELLS